MKTTEFLLGELDREAEHSRRALAEVPEGKHDWKPHDKSMIFGYLADMVATIPTWIAMQVTQDDLNIAPSAAKIKQEPKQTSAALLEALDQSATKARAALDGRHSSGDLWTFRR